MMLLLSDCFLCPGIGGQAHITDNANECACGNKNLASLSRILDREAEEESPSLYGGICFEQMPLIDRILAGKADC